MAVVILRFGGANQGTFEEHPSNVSELMRRLDQIGKEYGQRLGIPYAVDLIRDGVGTLSVGLGDEQSILMFFSSSEEEPVYSLGNEQATGVCRFYFGDVTALSRKYLVPRSAADSVIREWFEFGTLGDFVHWTREIYWPFDET